jgi:hypothetical protein
MMLAPRPAAPLHSEVALTPGDLLWRGDDNNGDVRVFFLCHSFFLLRAACVAALFSLFLCSVQDDGIVHCMNRA